MSRSFEYDVSMSFLVILGFIFLLPITLFALVPVGFAIASFKNLITLPFQMLRMAFDKRRRRNHALEHATVHVLEQRSKAIFEPQAICPSGLCQLLYYWLPGHFLLG